jgi:hypothetical protein
MIYAYKEIIGRMLYVMSKCLNSFKEKATHYTPKQHDRKQKYKPNKRFTAQQNHLNKSNTNQYDN